MAKAQPHPDYDVSDNTYNLKRQNVKDKHWDTEVGDRRNTTKFVPRIKYQRFDDGFLEIGVPNGLHGGGDSVTHEGNTIVWQRQIYTARFFDFEGDPENPDGGSYEWEVVLASVPPANSLTLDLRRQNVELLYQPALTAQEIADGHVRPDRVVGSYAVYHTQKNNHKQGEVNYECGKIGHIYRPRVTDNLGNTIWGEWNTDAETSGELTLTIDAAWLAAAAYPVTIDPTFGYTSVGASFQGCGNGTIAYGNSNATYQYTASSGDTATLLTVYGDKAFGTPTGTLAIYDVSGLDPNNQLVTGAVTPPASPGWASTSALSTGLVASTVYTVCWVTTSNSNWNIYLDTGGAQEASRDTVDTTFVLNDPWTEDASFNTQRFSMYATYTAGGGADKRVMVVS